MKKFATRIATLIFWLGIVLPLFTLGFEAVTHACAAAHFDPMPTWLHVGLILLVPTALGVVWLAGRKGSGQWLRSAAFLHAAALVSLLHYLLALGALTLFACWMLPFTLLFIPQGGGGIAALVLATLGPLAGLLGWWVAAVRLRRWRREIIVSPERGLRWPWRAGLAAGMLAVGAAELPMVLVYEDLHQAIRVTRGESVDAVVLERLRSPWRQEFLLRLCYDGGRPGNFGPLANQFDQGPMDDLAWLAGFRNMRTDALNVDSLRDVFFRVSGRVFSDLPPPRNRGSQRRGMRLMDDGLLDGFAWDEERGGSKVGARLRGLSLASSRMDWHLDKDSALAYGEWTLEFHNTHTNAQEARCQMLLPPRGCVSRLTLWINDEPREAAFGAKQQVTQAYQQTVVVDRRDPVLVNMIGPDRVMTQCFPVPPGGTMKIRLGITAPVDERIQQRLVLPLIIERNFSIPAVFKHAVWVQSNGRFNVSAVSKEQTVEKQGGWSYQSDVEHDKLSTQMFAVTDASAGKVWTEDPFATGEEGRILLREKAAAAETAARKRVIAVIDGSVQLQPHASAIRESLKALAVTRQVSAILSTDGEPLTLPSSQFDSAIREKAFRGGRDSIPALKAALKEARLAKEPITILWLHGPQPWVFPQTEVLVQFIERDVSPPVIHAVSLAHGRNSLLEKLYNQAELHAESHWDGSEENLNQIFQQACVETLPSHIFRRSSESPTDGVKVWDQLVRQFVFEEVLAAFKGQDRVPDAQAKLAARYQLVTPYSGAVVLETQQQYERAGLKPVDASTTPQIPNGTPEPSRMILLICGLLIMIMRRRR